MTSREIFVFRLRLHRRRKGLRVEDISAATRVRRERFDALEHNDLSHWPRGLHARAWVRLYASLVGLDPSDTVDEFCRLFPHGDRRAGPTLRGIAEIVAHPFQYEGEFREAERRRGPGHSDSLQAFPWGSAAARAVRALWGGGGVRPVIHASRP